jgi:hypothetical protein
MILVIWAMSVVRLGVGGAAEERLSIAGLDVMVWKPDETAPPALPIVVFSHGFHGCTTQSRFLMIALASAGYLVVASNHRDAVCNGGSARWIVSGRHLDFGITPALHRESIRVVSRHAKTRQKQLAVRGVAQLCGARHEARRNTAQPRNDRTRFIEPFHMDIARGENAV